MQKVLLIHLLALVFIAQPCYSKEKKLKFGRVSMEEMEMTIYPPDTSAPAVILFENGYYNAMDHTFKIFRRVKILTIEGLGYADFVFNTTSKGDIRGITYNLVDGRIEETKLGKESIFSEKVWDYHHIFKVAMPNVKVGSILDVEVLYSGFPTEWYFQHNIPTVKSEIELELSEYVIFTEHLDGLIFPEKLGQKHWGVTEMPAFINEQYLSSPNNYLSRIELDISQINIPGQRPLNFASSWKSVDKYFTQHPYFGEGLIWSSNFLNPFVDEIENSAISEEEKVKLAVAKIKSVARWNNQSRLYMSNQNLKDAMSEQSFNSADINLMLIKLLNKMNITAYPLVISTRENGFLSPFHPSIFKIDYVLAYVRVNDKFIPIDATDPLLPYNLLPLRCINYSGYVVNSKEHEIVSIEPPSKETKRLYHEFELTDDFSVTGKASYSNSGYAAYNLRRELQQHISQKSYINEWMGNNPGLMVSDFVIENVSDVDKPVIEKYEINLSDGLVFIDNKGYFNMFALQQITENPFKREDRKYPVDFIYPVSKSGVVRLTLPHNMKAEELPPAANIALPDNAARFTMLYQAMDSVVVLNYTLSINQYVFGEKQYADIKAFYDLIVSNQSKPVVLTLKN